MILVFRLSKILLHSRPRQFQSCPGRILLPAEPEVPHDSSSEALFAMSQAVGGRGIVDENVAAPVPRDSELRFRILGLSLAWALERSFA